MFEHHNHTNTAWKLKGSQRETQQLDEIILDEVPVKLVDRDVKREFEAIKRFNEALDILEAHSFLLSEKENKAISYIISRKDNYNSLERLSLSLKGINQYCKMDDKEMNEFKEHIYLILDNVEFFDEVV